MHRRPGYTLIELLVSMALIMMIMSILSQAYIAGMDTFSKLKGIGDMAEKLREVTSILRRDLAADHFTGGARISDPNYSMYPPREGFVRINPASQVEPPGPDANGNPSFVATGAFLHFSVKLRGNRQQDFFQGDQLPFNVAPIVTFFSQPPDATYTNVIPGGGYQWAEVAYYLLPIQDQLGQAMTSPGSTGAAPQQLYALYRAQRAVAANNPGVLLSPAQYPNMSISSQGVLNTPSSLQFPASRGIVGAAGMPLDALLLSDVLNFDVQVMPTAFGAVPNFFFNPNQGFDSSLLAPGQPGIRAVQIVIRVYDLKSRQTRQITLVQDL